MNRAGHPSHRYKGHDGKKSHQELGSYSPEARRANAKTPTRAMCHFDPPMRNSDQASALTGSNQFLYHFPCPASEPDHDPIRPAIAKAKRNIAQSFRIM